MRHRRRPFQVLLVCGFLLGAFAAPAEADHGSDPTSSHWGHGYPPKVTADCAESFLASVALCTATDDAELTWVNNGFRNGFNVGQPWLGCGIHPGYITVCMLNQDGMESRCGSATALGCVQRGFVFNPYKHIDWVVLSLCRNCYGRIHDRFGLQEGDRIVTRHEYGHALGLAHTGQLSSVMFGGPYGDSNDAARFPNQHDRDVMCAMYCGHFEG